jgi:O-antigen/teichoic acid export membrane protein
MSVASLLNPVLMALSSYLLPIFVKKNADFKQVDRSLKKWLVVFTLMSIILTLIGYFLGQTIITLIFGEKYADLGILVVFPYLVQSINIISQPFRIALNAIKRTDINFWILIPRSIISVVLGMILIGKYGIFGVFYTMFVENIFYQLVYYIFYKRIISKPESRN